MKIDEKNGRHIVTTKDLSVGETILMEKMYVGHNFGLPYQACTMCSRSNNNNLVPCSKCTVVLLCHETYPGGCRNRHLHKWKCGDTGILMPSNILDVPRIVIFRSIIMAVNLFPNIDEMIEFVENIVFDSNQFELPSFSSDHSAYRAFLKSYRYPGEDCSPEMIHYIYMTLMDLPEVAKRFNTEKYRRFLMHLVGYHRALAVTTCYVDQTCFDDEDEISFFKIGWGILHSNLKKVCIPNMMVCIAEGLLVGKVIRPIKNGEQLLNSNFTHSNMHPFAKQPIIEETCKLFNFIGCDQCNDPSSISRSNQLWSDPDYVFVHKVAKPSFTRVKPSKVDLRSVEERCVKFLTKYGRAKWCKELEFMVGMYVELLNFSDFRQQRYTFGLENIDRTVFNQ